MFLCSIYNHGSSGSEYLKLEEISCKIENTPLRYNKERMCYISRRGERKFLHEDTKITHDAVITKTKLEIRATISEDKQDVNPLLSVPLRHTDDVVFLFVSSWKAFRSPRARI